MKLRLVQELSKGNVRIGQLIMEVQGDNHYHEEKTETTTVETDASDYSEQRPVSSEQVGMALKQCGAYIWGHAAYSIAFCVCRDVYHMGDNASLFERIMAGEGIMMPEGTINSAMSRNPWMKYHIDRWEEQGVMERVLKLRDVFIRQMEMQGFQPKKLNSIKQEA